MAITLISNNGTFRPVFNPIQWVVSSTNISRCEFIYLCDVYINGDFITRLKAEAGINNYGYFRVERVLQDYLSKDFKHNLVGFSDNDNSACEYYLEFREQYNTNYATTCVGSDTISGVEYTSATCVAWNGGLQYKEYLDFVQNNYVLNSAATKFLNFTPNRTRIKLDDYFVATFLQKYATTAADTLQIKTYNSAFTLLNTYSIDNDSSPNASWYSVSVGVGVANLNDYSGALSPSVTWIDSSVSFYTVQLLDSTTAAISEAIVFEIDNRCTKFNSYRLWWMNRKGAYNSYNFDLLSTRRVDAAQNTYDKLLAVDYTEGDRGETVISVDARETYLFQTDRVRKDEVKFLEDLYTSPDIYVVDSNLINTNIAITGAVYNAGTVSFVLTYSGSIAIGTKFTYVVDDGSSIGMANAGGGVITGYDSITGYYETNVPCTINAGGLINGFMVAQIAETKIVPMVRVTSSFEDNSLPRAVNNGIFYSIELRPSFKINTQSF
nr:hypothetical protein [uncultured Flavobacterium sp.]